MAQIKITKSMPLKEVLDLAPACMCNSCSNGCKFGSGMLVEGDLKNIASYLKITEKEAKEKYFEEIELFNKKMPRPKLLRNNKPFGKCIFFDDKKGCTIHSVKPLQCKVAMGCKDYGEDLMAWFTSNFIVDANDSESIRQYAQYIKSGGKVIPGAELKDMVPDEKRLKKILAYDA